MRRPRLTKKVVEGLASVESLVHADVNADDVSYPKTDPVWDAIVYINRLRHWYRRNHEEETHEVEAG